jgi:dephospho-CoA kinase
MKRKKPLVGVTGIIGSGKSTVAKQFEKLENIVFNSDESAREITRESETLQEIQQQYGVAILNSSGQLDREKMAQLVFQNPAQLKKLNQIIHPRVREKMWEFVEKGQNNSSVNLILVDSPLIYETDLHRYLDFIIVVAAPEETCIERVKKRNNLSRVKIMERISQQIPLEEKIKKADFVIYNEKKVTDLTEQVENIYQNILSQWSKNP